LFTSAIGSAVTKKQSMSLQSKCEEGSLMPGFILGIAVTSISC